MIIFSHVVSVRFSLHPPPPTLFYLRSITCCSPSILSLKVIFNPWGSLSNCFYIVCVYVGNAMRKHMPCILNIWNMCKNIYCCGQQRNKNSDKRKLTFEKIHTNFCHFFFEQNEYFHYYSRQSSMQCIHIHSFAKHHKICGINFCMYLYFSASCEFCLASVLTSCDTSEKLFIHTVIQSINHLSAYASLTFYLCMIACLLSYWLGVNKMCRVFFPRHHHQMWSNLLGIACNSIWKKKKKIEENLSMKWLIWCVYRRLHVKMMTMKKGIGKNML